MMELELDSRRSSSPFAVQRGTALFRMLQIAGKERGLQDFDQPMHYTYSQEL